MHDRGLHEGPWRKPVTFFRSEREMKISLLEILLLLESNFPGDWVLYYTNLFDFIKFFKHFFIIPLKLDQGMTFANLRKRIDDVGT